jgi:repressor LexA
MTDIDTTHILTWRQKAIVNAVKDFIGVYGYVPTMREIGQAVGLSSSSSVHYQVRLLQSKGYLREMRPGRNKSDV